MCKSTRFLSKYFLLFPIVTALTIFLAADYASALKTVTLSGAAITYSDVVTADFNGDGYKEIVAAGSDGLLYVVATTNGTSWTVAWSRQCNTEILTAVAALGGLPPDPYPDKQPASVVIYPIEARATNVIEAPPAIADLDNDGKLDIVVAMGGNIHKGDDFDNSARGNGGILVYEYVSDSPWQFQLSGDWPQPKIDRVGRHSADSTPSATGGFSYPDGLWDGIMTSPAIGDLDGDGDLEIVIAGIDRRIHAYHHTGVAVAGWPIWRYNGDYLLRGGVSSPALGDIDNDGLVEVVVGTMSPPWPYPNAPDYTKGTIWAINGDSSNVPGWPVATEQLIDSSPALGDIDNDGELEVVVGAGFGTAGRDNLVFAFNSDGSSVPNWPVVTKSTMAASPALGDIDGDNIPEIVIGCGNKGDLGSCGANDALLYALNGDGTPVAGFPVQSQTASAWIPNTSYSMPFTPVIADVDGDSLYEILIVQLTANGISIVETNGVTNSFRRPAVDVEYLISSPLVDDIDNDGNLEIVAGGGNTLTVGDTEVAKIYIWDETSTNINLPWPMNRRDAERTGLFPRAWKKPPPNSGGKGYLPSIYYLLQNP